MRLPVGILDPDKVVVAGAPEGPDGGRGGGGVQGTPTYTVYCKFIATSR